MSRSGEFDVGSLAKAVDQAREHANMANEIASWTHGTDHWAPLHKSDVPADEHGAWMFMGHETSAGPDEPGAHMWNYKHGVSRTNIHLDEHGRGYTFRWHNNAPHHFGPWSATEVLKQKGHYDSLEKQGQTPQTTYDDDFRAARNTKLRDAGFHVLEG